MAALTQRISVGRSSSGFMLFSFCMESVVNTPGFQAWYVLSGRFHMGTIPLKQLPARGEYSGSPQVVQQPVCPFLWYRYRISRCRPEMWLGGLMLSLLYPVACCVNTALASPQLCSAPWRRHLRPRPDAQGPYPRRRPPRHRLLRPPLHRQR